MNCILPYRKEEKNQTPTLSMERCHIKMVLNFPRFIVEMQDILL